uniref:Uncharacterized protein n=1 Tax=Anguilla anguilla TaxID=7936 RepID=A0A0E9U3J3_ANGAN
MASSTLVLLVSLLNYLLELSQMSILFYVYVWNAYCDYIAIDKELL